LDHYLAGRTISYLMKVTIMRRLTLSLVLLIPLMLSARPASAQTAVCRDGTYSYSQHRSGTCSHHGGVARWGSGPRTTRPTPAHRSTRPAPARTRRGPARRSSAASRGYYTGPRGGCYTYTASGRKRYVDHSYCR
jgi:hypothetical protein